MEPQGPALIWCPFPDAGIAAATAKTLLDERLVACANILPAMLSLFEWNGERGEATEAGALFKTDAALLE
ncbi:MAG TPA: divalent cation tolerance protein CutA, partial [Novosphingobium sp.]